MAELKPCPFCGSTYIRVGDSYTIDLLSIQFKEPIAFVECMNCYAVAGLFKKHYKYRPDYDAKNEAIKAWNTRAKESERE